MAQRARTLLIMAVAAVFLAGCQVSEFASVEKHLAPVPDSVKRKMASKDMDERSPILMRIFKEESELEVWKKNRSGQYALLDSYEICAWSGNLGPKLKEGDRQAPEGFYTIHPYQMNPNSSYHLAFNLGFPNRFDRSHGRTGSHLMVHGDCSSRGCYAMEDDQIEIIYALARDAFRGGQTAFQVQAFPFRMTPENMARHYDNKWMPFWKELKEGYDHFEVTRREPKVDVCGRRYVFNAKPRDGNFSPTQECPIFDVPQDIWVQVASKQREDQERFERLIARKENRERREEEWEARRAMIASFFGNEDTKGVSGTETAAEEAASIAAAVRGSQPRRTAALADPAAPVPAAVRVGEEIPAARTRRPAPPAAARTVRDEPPAAPAATVRTEAPAADAETARAQVASVPVPRTAPERPAPVAEARRARATARADSALRQPAVVAASTAAPSAPAPATPAGVASTAADEARDEDDKRGLLAGVASGTKNAVGAATSGVGSLWRGATGLFN